MKSNRELLKEIRLIHEWSKERYGSPRVHRELKARGHKCNEKRVSRLMRENKLSARHKRKFRRTTDSKHLHPVAPNLLARSFDAQTENQIWLADITYLWTDEGWLYLACVMDMYSRRIVGWSMAKSLSQQLAIDALRMALHARMPKAGLIHHSDRGCQYAANDYKILLRANGIVQSMSRKGDCWDNAPMESFFHTLKTELVHRTIFKSRAQARRNVFEFIEVFYNRQRRHSAIDYKTPVEFERAA